jgi:hypothetical protein
MENNGYILPSTSSITSINNTNPMPPLGPYPHCLLWGQVGMTPSSIKTTTINRIVPTLIFFSLLCATAAAHETGGFTAGL